MVAEINAVIEAHKQASCAYNNVRGVLSHLSNGTQISTALGVASSSLLQAIGQMEKAVRDMLPAAMAQGFALPETEQAAKPAAENPT